VDVLGVVAVIASVSALAPLPELPAQGLAVEEKNGVAFVDFRGRRLAAVPGLEFFGQDTNAATGLPRFRDAQGGRWRVDRQTHRFVAAPDGLPLAGGAKLDYVPRLSTWFVRREGRVVLRVRTPRESFALSEDRDVVSTRGRALDLRARRTIELPGGPECSVASRRGWILLCRAQPIGATLPVRIDALTGGRRVAVAAPPVRRSSDGRIHGHWRYLLVSPDGRRILAQWSGECEIPTAFLIERGSTRPLGASSYAKAPVSFALGWLPNGSAVIHFPQGACGGTHRVPGVYVVPRSGKPRLVIKVSGFGRVAMWGG
jgi:hypothetical protein